MLNSNCGTGGAAGAGLALGEIEDAGRPATGVHGQESAAAGLFDIVAMGCDGKDVEFQGRGHRVKA